jgi:polyisoprenoid-binding protein YceI
VWTFDNGRDTLQVLTGVDGIAARMGHRLTLAVESWHAELSWDGDRPSRLALTADVASFVVESGEGGVTPLTSAERAVARSNALKSLNVKRFPQIRYSADSVDATDSGYRLTGQLDIHGRRRDHVVDVTLADDQVACRSEVRQSDFGIKPYSLMMGSLRVADAVTVVFAAPRPTA